MSNRAIGTRPTPRQDALMLHVPGVAIVLHQRYSFGSSSTKWFYWAFVTINRPCGLLVSYIKVRRWNTEKNDSTNGQKCETFPHLNFHTCQQHRFITNEDIVGTNRLQADRLKHNVPFSCLAIQFSLSFLSNNFRLYKPRRRIFKIIFDTDLHQLSSELRRITSQTN